MAIHFVKTAVFPHGMAPSGETAALQMVELCGRTAYKSEDRITDDSAKSFVLMLKKHNHLSVLEHSNIVLKLGEENDGPGIRNLGESLVKCLGDRNAFHRFYFPADSVEEEFIVSGNFRSWIETLKCLRETNPIYFQLFSFHLERFFPSLFGCEGNYSDPIQCSVSLVNEEEQLGLLIRNPSCDLPVFMFKIICDRGITHEIVRHRVLSFTQESTRYVNYRNKGMTLIVPEEMEPFVDERTGSIQTEDPLAKAWETRAKTLFSWYQEDIGRGLRPEIARDILPNLLKSEIFVSGRWSGWKHFVNLRHSKQAHPRIRFIAAEVRNYFESLGMSFE